MQFRYENHGGFMNIAYYNQVKHPSRNGRIGLRYLDFNGWDGSKKKANTKNPKQAYPLCSLSLRGKNNEIE